MKYLLMVLCFGLMINGCAAKKVIVKSCEKAGNAELFICDPL